MNLENNDDIKKSSIKKDETTLDLLTLTGTCVCNFVTPDRPYHPPLELPYLPAEAVSAAYPFLC
jgi:hypothetical protein